MSSEKTVLVGLSGGVDSAVAAYLLQQQGFNVIGVTMAIWDGEFESSGGNACYGPNEEEDIAEAKSVADFLHIPYHVIDCKKEYNTIVLDYFKSEYLAGRTPNPCIRCNQQIKLGILPQFARESGIQYDYFATGHYAQVRNENNRFFLQVAKDIKKDQTYFLYRLSQEQLQRQLFPLGELTKPEVRAIAQQAGLPVKDKEESQDFYCGDYKDILGVDDMPGDIVMTDGKVLGKHNGFWNYTIGQRKGLGVAYTEPLYVIRLNKKDNTVVVGTKEEVLQSSFFVDDLTWMAIPELKEEMDVMVKIRSANKASLAVIQPINSDSVKVIFHEPKDAITPGQSAVFYLDDAVIGGGVIKSVTSTPLSDHDSAQ